VGLKKCREARTGACWSSPRETISPKGLTHLWYRATRQDAGPGPGYQVWEVGNASIVAQGGRLRTDAVADTGIGRRTVAGSPGTPHRRSAAPTTADSAGAPSVFQIRVLPYSVRTCTVMRYWLWLCCVGEPVSPPLAWLQTWCRLVTPVSHDTLR